PVRHDGAAAGGEQQISQDQPNRQHHEQRRVGEGEAALAERDDIGDEELVDRVDFIRIGQDGPQRYSSSSEPGPRSEPGGGGDALFMSPAARTTLRTPAAKPTRSRTSMSHGDVLSHLSSR